MTHPEDLLADYVDGTLPDRERAVVDAHLEGCAACREDVELARSAVTALATLEERPVPLGVTGPVLAEAGRRFERGRSRTWQRIQWAAGAGVAAALVLVVALSGGLGGDGGNDAREAALEAGDGADTSAGSAAGEEATLVAALPPLELQRDVTYTEEGIRALAEEAQASAEAPQPTAPQSDMSRFAEPDPAVRCLRKAGAPVNGPDVLVRLIEATFDDSPAYLAVFLQSPGAGQPADHVVVWVVAIEGCRILHTASLPI